MIIMNSKKAVTLKTLADQDWKTQLAHKYPNIPYNVVVDVIEEEFTNFYGTWCRVVWNKTMYYVSRTDLDFSEQAIKEAEHYWEEELKPYEEKFKTR